MAYADYQPSTLRERLGIQTHRGELFPGLGEVGVPGWVTDLLRRTMEHALVSEKARSEFIVAPVLTAVRELSGKRVALYSGDRLDVDPERGLVGEFDFMLSVGEPLPWMVAPVVAVVEAKKNDIEAGLAQCIAQMAGARMLNERAGQAERPVFGCVTTGEDWQFLRLMGDEVALDTGRLYLVELGRILAAFLACIEQAGGPGNGEVPPGKAGVSVNVGGGGAGGTGAVMAYSNFSMASVLSTFGLAQHRQPLFPDLGEAPVSAWLTQSLAYGKALTLLSEKARNEYIVAPILMAVRRLTNDRVAIYSGENFDVAPERGLNGECDFILALGAPVIVIEAPIVAVVEAKKQDIEAGVGLCLAQLVAARECNDRAGRPTPCVFGCVTTGNNWLFLRLEGQAVTIDLEPLYLVQLGRILAAFLECIEQAVGPCIVAAPKDG